MEAAAHAPAGDPAETGADSAAADSAGKQKRSRRAVPTPADTIRFSLDLDRAEHQQMKLFAIEQGTQASVIGRILVEMLNADPQIADRVAARLNELRQP
jgi:hypothetical protein